MRMRLPSARSEDSFPERYIGSPDRDQVCRRGLNDGMHTDGGRGTSGMATPPGSLLTSRSTGPDTGECDQRCPGQSQAPGRRRRAGQRMHEPSICQCSGCSCLLRYHPRERERRRHWVLEPETGLEPRRSAWEPLNNRLFNDVATKCDHEGAWSFPVCAPHPFIGQAVGRREPEPDAEWRLILIAERVSLPVLPVQ